jgi:hypothetical protein
MHAVTEDVYLAMCRWHRAFVALNAETPALAAATQEFQQACLSLAAAMDDASIPCDQRPDYARWAAEGGRGA